GVGVTSFYRQAHGGIRQRINRSSQVAAGQHLDASTGNFKVGVGGLAVVAGQYHGIGTGVQQPDQATHMGGVFFVGNAAASNRRGGATGGHRQGVGIQVVHHERCSYRIDAAHFGVGTAARRVVVGLFDDVFIVGQLQLTGVADMEQRGTRLASFADKDRANAQIRFVSFYAHYSAPFLVAGAAGLAMPWARSQSAMAGATLILSSALYGLPAWVCGWASSTSTGFGLAVMGYLG